MQDADGIRWSTDSQLLTELPGGLALLEWFEGVPFFHDATLDRLEIADACVTIKLRAFRMTSEVDEGGHFILDKHAVVAIRLSGVTGIAMKGDASAIISELGIRRLTVDTAGWQTSAGPKRGDFEVSFESSYGLEASVFARGLTFQTTPGES